MQEAVLEQRFARARLARTPRRRVAASVLETATMFLPAALAFLYEVDGHGVQTPVMALRAAEASLAMDTDEVIRRLLTLEPIDPFSVRRAQAVGAVALGVDDVGGAEEVRRSMFGRHLQRLELGPPLHAYLWSGSRVVAGITFLRGTGEAGFRRQECALLGKIAPLLGDAVLLADGAPGLLPVLPEERLTEREREVAHLVLAGVSNAAVSKHLEMSEATVKTHLTRIYAKLGIRSRTELAGRFRRA